MLELMDGHGHPSHNGAPRRARRMSRSTPAVSVILGINIVVFLAWQASAYSIVLRQFMVENFLVSTTHLKHGLFWTLLTSAFSHAELWHLAINMIVLWSFGTLLERLWGTRVFVAFYLVAAVIASATHCAVSSLYLHNDDISALGASGAISGLLIVFALYFPHQKILLFFAIPIPALFAALAFIGLDVWGLVAQGHGGGLPIGHGAHLGGALAGVLMYFAYLRSAHPGPPAHARRSAVGVPALTEDEAREFERIRIKVESQGPHALTPKEQAFLQSLRERVLGAGHPSG
jgi:membrane associated rhomboid family serine protease